MKPASPDAFVEAVEAAHRMRVGPGTVYLCTPEGGVVLQDTHLVGNELCGLHILGLGASENVCFQPADVSTVGIAYKSFAVGYYSVPVYEACAS